MAVRNIKMKDMRINTVLILAAFSALLLSGCRKDEIDLFGEERYIYFNSIEGSHEYHYNFIYSSGKDEVTLDLPIGYSGRLYTEDKPYSVSVDEENTTAGTDEYAIPENPVFKGNMYSDVLTLTLKNSARLETSEQKISLKLVTNGSFIAAVRDSLVMDIYITDMISQPAWWTDEVTEAYLGRYSDTKLQLFIDNVYAGDYGELSEDEKLYYARKFKYWLEENPQTDEYGQITVPVIG